MFFQTPNAIIHNIRKHQITLCIRYKVENCRKLFEKYLIWRPENWECWIKYAEFERALGETQRVQALFDLDIEQEQKVQEVFESPKMLWRSYIEFEISEGEVERTRQLYERLLDRTNQQLMLWIRYARFEAQENHSIEHATRVFRRAADCLRIWEGNEEKLSVLRQNWLDMEASFDELGDVSLVHSKLPKELKRNIEEDEKIVYLSDTDFPL